MANRQVGKRRFTLETEPMVERDVDHICTYVVDEEDRNFKYCVYCGHIAYRTNDEIMGEYTIALERGLGGD